MTHLLANNKHEVRAVWVTTIGGLDWPRSYAQSTHSIEKQKTELRDMLDRLKLANINTILLQTRVRATTIYPSDIEPWDGCLSGFPGKSPGYDPLAFAIEECHKRGMELHAWVVCIPIGKWNNYGCRELRKRRPDLVKRIGDEGFVDPEKKASADYIAQICEEITRKYDIDGIHLDYIRYPETWKGRIDPQRGRGNITRIVERVNEKVKTIKPWVKMSCSPVGKHDDLTRYSSRGWNARTKVCQDAQAWLANGLMDQLYPMMYFQGNQFYPFAIDWNENRNERIIAPGLGIYFLSPKEKNWDVEVVSRQLHFLRDEGMGHAFFRCKFLLDDVKGLYGIVKDEINNVPSLVPPMPIPTRYAQNTTMPQQPAKLTLKRGKGFDRLVWTDNKAFPQANGDYHLFNIYASESYPVDINNPDNYQLHDGHSNKGEGSEYALCRYGDRPLRKGKHGGYNTCTKLNKRQGDTGNVDMRRKTPHNTRESRCLGRRVHCNRECRGKHHRHTSLLYHKRGCEQNTTGLLCGEVARPQGIRTQVGIFYIKEEMKNGENNIGY